jgi:hypothetical protein
MDAEQTRDAYPSAASGWNTYHGKPPKAEQSGWNKSAEYANTHSPTTQNGTKPTTQDETLSPPSTIGELTLKQIIKALSRPLPDSMLESRKQGGSNIKYISWHTANKVLDKYAPGWNWSIVKIELSADRIFLIGRLSIPTSEGLVYREATGTELLKEDKQIWLGEKPNQKPLKDEFDRIVTEQRELAYGDPSSNAESMAFRRAAARFGLGLYLY